MTKKQAPEIVSRKAASKKISDTAQAIYNDIMKGTKKPSMQFPVRSLANVKYDVKQGYFKLLGKRVTRTLSYTTVKTFAQSMRLLATTKNDLLDRDDIAGKREVYYNSKSWGECRFDEQPESDALLDDMEAMLGINREQLGYIPEERGGDVTGALTVIDKDPATGDPIKINCAKLGTGAWSIPSRVEHLEFQTKAKFILVVETSSLFQRLVHHRYYENANCILISMSGVPTRACRRFIRRLSDDQKLPVLAFTDGDPYGYCNIYRTLKAGSGQAAHINEFFCVPNVRYLGVTPQDIIDYNLEDATHPLEEVDIKRAKDALKNDPFIRHHREWQQALEQMLKMGVRIEQQAFAKHGLNFVLDTYLPQKIKKGKFLP
ncbi:MAG TPA: DNA topoisomerase IV subunit A [Kiritimatiellia bacterium]|nr:DNA topoisomerase IV subunit A [Kiritimatiellia bacterium]HNR93473.1 DNA topoisomerase IV subunit A [Kiritimatiellia bacterium]HNS80204.1 DNA topoisomerase IV subunit A [Kiritimatiellia bacterium]HPA78049.1 DNA topoisomerase IV subunit A [Kiritimatiellia bacterium]HQQ04163.1 DNA topoisomerase IV subunit A [Kiritimatiellia bacterium]